MDFKQYFGLFLIVLFSCNLVFGLGVTSEAESSVIVKELENRVEFTLKIDNATTGTYNVYTLADLSLQPSQTFQITDTYLEKDFTLTPTENLNVKGYYTFTYFLNHRNVEQVSNKFTVKIVSLEDVLEVGSESIDFETGKITFYVRNAENVEIKDLKASFSSIFFKDTPFEIDLKPFETKTYTVSGDLDKLKRTKAGVYVISSVFETKKGEVTIDGNLYLGETKGVSTTEDAAGLLVRTETITKINTGNVLESVQIKMSRNIISRLFTSFTPEPTIVNRDGLGISYIWVKENLGPSEIFSVKAKTNYVLPFLIIVFGILAIIGFRRFNEAKVSVKKSVSHVKTKNGEFALKVKISLKALQSIENVTLIDKVPPIVKIYKKFGMVEPDKIDPESRRIHWHVGDLASGEERIFTYIVYSKIGVVGKFSLPEAAVVFEKEGRIHESNSNQVFFLSDQVRGD